MQRFATYWWAVWFGIALLCVIAGVTGMAFMPDATTSPDEYPARFLILGITAFVWGAPGWIASIVLMVRR